MALSEALKILLLRVSKTIDQYCQGSHLPPALPFRYCLGQFSRQLLLDYIVFARNGPSLTGFDCGRFVVLETGYYFENPFVKIIVSN